MSEEDTKKIALKLYRVVYGPGDGGGESSFDCLNRGIKEGWMRLARVGAKDKVINELEADLSAAQAREAELLSKLHNSEVLAGKLYKDNVELIKKLKKIYDAPVVAYLSDGILCDSTTSDEADELIIRPTTKKE